ncbi:rhodanese-like domain-containing protein [Neptunicella sp. SCSIO 80796]|uniref:rhodanese-like domain-containing protein n=1 Tax=Neptunicella plasticusilytica TaxID=3117012 RepID=UPI003A4D7F04
MRAICFLLLSVVCFSTLAATPLISQQALLTSDDNERLILDVRSQQEFAQGHVPGAINIPHTDLANQIDKLTPYQDKTIVLYCRSGRRAEIAADTLTKLEFKHLLHLEGDMQGWIANQRAVEKQEIEN